jgi:DNA-binding GntR family transcriptional regulator
MRAKFTKITPLSLSDRVSNALKDAFFSGELKPGDPIVERDIAKQMKVGTPVVREALISLQGQGFVRRVINTATYVTKFNEEEISQLYSLRVELEVLALQWARTRVTEADLKELTQLVDGIVEAAGKDERREFLENDFAFHRRCWELSGNDFLADTLERLMAPFFVFGILANRDRLTGVVAREHYVLVEALRNLKEPEFTESVSKVLIGFSGRRLIIKELDATNADSSATVAGEVIGMAG